MILPKFALVLLVLVLAMLFWVALRVVFGLLKLA